MNTPIEDENDTSEELGLVHTQNCAEECAGAEESTVPAEDDLQALAADAIIMEEGLSKLVTVRIRLAGRVVLPTEDCAEVCTKANESSVPAEEYYEECSVADESFLPEVECAKVKKKRRLRILGMRGVVPIRLLGIPRPKERHRHLRP